MAELLHMRELSSKDTMALALLNRKLYAKGVRESYRGIKAKLKKAEAEWCILSLGLFSNGRLVGCILGFAVKPAKMRGLSDVEKITKDKVIYINDLAVEPGYIRHLREMIERFTRICRGRFPHLPIFAHGLGEGMLRWYKRHTKIWEEMGYLLTCLQEVPEKGPKPDRYLVQFTPFDETDRHLRPIAGRTPARPQSQSYNLGGHTYKVELIRDEAGWLALKPVWDSLHQQNHESTIFQSFDYHQTWWFHFGLPGRLYILTVSCGGKVIGIAPLQLTTVNVLGRYYRELGFIGSSWEESHPAFILSTDPRESCQAIQRFLFDRKDDWDICRFREQPGGMDAVQWQPCFKERGYLTSRTEDSGCSCLQLHGTWEKFLANRSKKIREELAMAKRKLSELGRISHHTHQSEDLSAQFEIYKAIEEKNWKIGNGMGGSRGIQYEYFYRDLATVFGPKKSFSIRILKVGEKPVAVTLGLVDRKRYYSLQVVQDPDYAKLLAGGMLEAMEIKESFKNGYEECNLPGIFQSNFIRYTDQFQHIVQICGYRPTPHLHLVHLFHLAFKSRSRMLHMHTAPKHMPGARQRIKAEGAMADFLSKKLVDHR